MNDLQVAKAIAGLEGAESLEHLGCAILVKHPVGEVIVNGVPHMIYNPITDLALNCMLRDKYEVTIEYLESMDCLSCSSKGYAEVVDRADIPRAVCEAILKANGLWV